MSTKYIDENKALKTQLLDEYAKLEAVFHPSGVTVGTYDTPVNFNESLKTPIHRWYGYKEGFSPSFVRDFINKYSVSKDSVVFDPFGGVGTTGLEAIKMGHNSFLMDVNPLGLFASKVKTKHYSSQDCDNISAICENLTALNDYPLKAIVPNETVVRYFAPVTWNALLKIKSYISDISQEMVRDVFSLALLSLIEEISTHHKNGNGVKKKRVLPPESNFDILKTKVIEKVHLFLDDIESVKFVNNCTILSQSNLEPYNLPVKADIVLTSPPYANCFDYSKVYLTELWVGGFFVKKDDQNSFRDKSVISHVHYRWQPRNESYGSTLVNELIAPILNTKELWSNNIIPMLKGYFSDMGKFLYNLSENLNVGATVGIVVGNSVYGGTPIATDIILAKQAEEQGYSCEQIKVYRKVIASSQQMIILTDSEKELVRESLVVLKWQGKKK